jgi:hypothetical protein
MLPQHNIELEP